MWKDERTVAEWSRIFLTFTDDKTHDAWVYILKHKDQVFKQFVEWKAMVETSTGTKLKTLSTDNGGEYTSAEFEEYLKAEGVQHELTIPKTPKQNGVDECMNRTLVRSMLSDAKLPPNSGEKHCQWRHIYETGVLPKL